MPLRCMREREHDVASRHAPSSQSKDAPSVHEPSAPSTFLVLELGGVSRRAPYATVGKLEVMRRTSTSGDHNVATSDAPEELSATKELSPSSLSTFRFGGFLRSVTAWDSGWNSWTRPVTPSSVSNSLRA